MGDVGSHDCWCFAQVRDRVPLGGCVGATKGSTLGDPGPDETGWAEDQSFPPYHGAGALAPDAVQAAGKKTPGGKLDEPGWRNSKGATGPLFLRLVGIGQKAPMHVMGEFRKNVALFGIWTPANVADCPARNFAPPFLAQSQGRIRRVLAGFPRSVHPPVTASLVCLFLRASDQRASNKHRRAS